MRGRPAGQTKLAQPAGGGGGWLRAAPCLAQKAAQTGPQADRGGGGAPCQQAAHFLRCWNRCPRQVPGRGSGEEVGRKCIAGTSLPRLCQPDVPPPPAPARARVPRLMGARLPQQLQHPSFQAFQASLLLCPLVPSWVPDTVVLSAPALEPSVDGFSDSRFSPPPRQDSPARGGGGPPGFRSPGPAGRLLVSG